MRLIWTLLFISSGLVFRDYVLNKEIVSDLMQACWFQKDSVKIQSLVNKDYVEHNPVCGNGVQSLIRFSFENKPLFHVLGTLAENDMVVVYSVSTGWNEQKSFCSFDIYRVMLGKLVEHWSVHEAINKDDLEAKILENEEMQINYEGSKAMNKRVVMMYYKEVLIEHKAQNLKRYILDNLFTDHNKFERNGLHIITKEDSLNRDSSVQVTQTVRFIAEGNFVFVFSRGVHNGKRLMLADLFKVSNGKISNHWGVQQFEVDSENSLNRNDMYTQLTL